jgi:hypothetical protein
MVTTGYIHEVSTVWILSSYKFNLMTDTNLIWDVLVYFVISLGTDSYLR